MTSYDAGSEKDICTRSQELSPSGARPCLQRTCQAWEGDRPPACSPRAPQPPSGHRYSVPRGQWMAPGSGSGANENLREAGKHGPSPLQVRTPELGAQCTRGLTRATAVLPQNGRFLFISCRRTERGFQLQAALPRGRRRGRQGASACEGAGQLPLSHRVPVPTSQRPTQTASADAGNRRQERFTSVTRHRFLRRSELPR